MTRTSLFAALLLAGLAVGASPALAGTTGGHICLDASSDRNRPGPPVTCVWTPYGATRR